MNYDVQRLPKAMICGNGSDFGYITPMAERARKSLRRTNRDAFESELRLRHEERRKERTRIARELHDTLFQGVFSASLLLHDAAEKLPSDSPGKGSVSRALDLMRSVMDDARVVLQGLRSSSTTAPSLENALSALRDEYRPKRDVEFRICVHGAPRTLRPEVQEQVFLMGREALVNALRHSEATNIEAQVEYLPRKIRVLVRDNGRGIDPQLLRSRRDSHWGLLGMQERATSIGAKLRIWSKPGIGTDVEISVSGDLAACA